MWCSDRSAVVRFAAVIAVASQALGLSGCESGGEQRSEAAEEEPATAVTSALLEERLTARLGALDARSSLYAKHLPTGREVAVRADEPMNSLSVIKIPIMALAFQDAEDGRLNLDARHEITPDEMRGGSGLLKTFQPGLRPTYRDLVMQMIITSDNTATDILIGRLGLERVNRFLSDQGYRETRLRSTTGEIFRRVLMLTDPEAAGLTDREVFEYRRSAGADAEAARFAFEGDSTEWFGRTTAREMGQLLESIFQGDMANQEHTADMIDILRSQFYSSRLPRYIQFDAVVAHKTGDWPPHAGNDVGILIYDGGPAIVSVFVNQNRGSFVDVEDAIGRIAQEIIRSWGPET